NCSFRQQSPRLPQLGEEFLLERELQVGRSGASPGSYADADNTLDQLNVPQPPAHHQFVKLREPLTNINPVAMMVLVLVEFVDGAGASFELLLLAGVRAGLRQLAHCL